MEIEYRAPASADLAAVMGLMPALYHPLASSYHFLVWDSSPASAFLAGTPPPLAFGAGQVLPQGTAGLGVGVDVLIARFLAHVRPPLFPGSATIISGVQPSFSRASTSARTWAVKRRGPNRLARACAFSCACFGR